MWFDTHCHLTDEQFADDFDDVLSRAAGAGVDDIIVVGDRLESSRQAIASAGVRETPDGPVRLYATAGVHPHNAGEWSEAASQELRELCRGVPDRAANDPGTGEVPTLDPESRSTDRGCLTAHKSAGSAPGQGPGHSEEAVPPPGLAAIGEVGLDFYYDNAPRERQIEAFLAQTEIAREFGLPLVIHCRKAYGLLVDLIRQHDLARIGGVVHCFGGTPDEALSLADMGFFLGIGGALTFKKGDRIREVARSASVKSLVLETDAPYLAPVPRRGKRNEPAFHVYTGQRLAEELGVEESALTPRIRSNALRLFRLGESVPLRRASPAGGRLPR